jgi:hypothetical protein
MQAVISHADLPSSTSVPYSLHLENLNIDANQNAQQCLAIFAEKVGYSEHIHCRNATSSLAWIQFGDSNPPQGMTGTGYQYFLEDILVQGGGNGLPATLSASSAGGVPQVTVTNSGSYVYPQPPVYLSGFGAVAQPCTTMGIATAVMSGTGPYTLSSVTLSGFSGCTGTIYAYVPDLAPARYGILIDNLTDSTFKNLVVAGVGQSAGIQYTHGSNTSIGEHPYGYMPIGVRDMATNRHYGAELDSLLLYGADVENSQSQWTDTEFLWVGGQPYGGASGFYNPVYGMKIDGSVCNGVSANTNGFSLVVTSSGPVGHQRGAIYPPYFNISGAQQCDTLAYVTSTYLATASTLDITTNSATIPSLTWGSGSNTTVYAGAAGGRGMFGYNQLSGRAVVQGGAGNGLEFDGNSSSFGSGVLGGYVQGGLPFSAIGKTIVLGSSLDVTIAPALGIVHVSGTGSIENITVPSGCGGGIGCQVELIPDDGWTTVYGGNIARATTALANKVLTMTYDSAYDKWFPSY